MTNNAAETRDRISKAEGSRILDEIQHLIFKKEYAEAVARAEEFYKILKSQNTYVENQIIDYREGFFEGRWMRYDPSLRTWSFVMPLHKERIWFLSVYIHDNGKFDHYSLDCELADDSHYYFSSEERIRKAIYQEGDENKELIDVFSSYVERYGGYALRDKIAPSFSFSISF